MDKKKIFGCLAIVALIAFIVFIKFSGDGQSEALTEKSTMPHS